jgi:thiol-disulfide isomerase/thioredoxin
MRFLFSFILLPFLSVAQNLQVDSFRVEVKFQGYKSVKSAWLVYEDSSGEEKADTVRSSSATFVFKGITPHPQTAYVCFTNEWPYQGKMRSDTSVFGVFLVADTTSITKLPSRSVIEGRQSVKDYYELTTRFYRQLFSIPSLTENEITDTSLVSKAKQIKKFRDSVRIKIAEDIYLNYLKEHPNSELVEFALEQLNPVDKTTADRYLALTDSLPEKIRASKTIISYRKFLLSFKNSLPGMLFPELVQKDTSGKEVSIRSFKGKIVLVDFWASWCIPCREGHPELVKIYNRFKDKNFTIFSVALEDDKSNEQWKKAIRIDGLIWSQGTDFNSWKNAVSSALGIYSIPSNILVNEKGIIIGKNLRGKELEETLEKILK